MTAEASARDPKTGRVGTRLGRLLLAERIGHGGFAIVYRARDEGLDADVAVKVLAENHSLDPDIRRRFLDEARLLRRVQNSSLVHVHDIGETDNLQPYLVLEYAAGGTLRDRLAGGRQATRADLRALTSMLQQGLTSLHEAGIVHRDVSPANVFIRADDMPRPTTTGLLAPGEELILGDLGLAKDLTEASGITVAAGTPLYAAPEQQVQGATVGPPADVYGASALLRGVAAGTMFESAIIAATVDGMAVNPAERPSLDLWAAGVLRSLERGNRPVSARAGRKRQLLAAAVGLAIATVGVFGVSQLRGPNSDPVEGEAAASKVEPSAESSTDEVLAGVAGGGDAQTDPASDVPADADAPADEGVREGSSQVADGAATDPVSDSSGEPDGATVGDTSANDPGDVTEEAGQSPAADEPADDSASEAVDDGSASDPTDAGTGDDTPAADTPGDEAPGDGTAGDDASRLPDSDDSAGDGQPDASQDPPVDDAVDGAVEDAPVQDEPVPDEPAENTSEEVQPPEAVIGNGRLDPGWYDESWGIRSPLDQTGAVELEGFGALSLISFDPVALPSSTVVVAIMRGDPELLTIRLNDAAGEPLQPCPFAGSSGLVTNGVVAGTARMVVPLSLLGVTDGALSRISLQDRSGEPVSFVVDYLALEQTAALGSAPSCGS